MAVNCATASAEIKGPPGAAAGGFAAGAAVVGAAGVAAAAGGVAFVAGVGAGAACFLANISKEKC